MQKANRIRTPEVGWFRWAFQTTGAAVLAAMVLLGGQVLLNKPAVKEASGCTYRQGDNWVRLKDNSAYHDSQSGTYVFCNIPYELLRRLNEWTPSFNID